MDKKELFKLYEKLYFHEIESRDKITSRLQLPLAIFVSILSMLGFMIRNINFHLDTTLIVSYYVCLFITITPVFFGIYYFIKAFYGHEYQLMPTASETEEYNLKLHKTYEEFDSGKELAEKYLTEYLYKDYHECSSVNSETNDKRSEFIHRSNFFIILSILPLLVTFLMFSFAHIDKNNKDNTQETSTKYYHREVEAMTDKENAKIPPPPPPPPPKRHIREDVEIGSGNNKEKSNKNGDK
jgi:hypothetical protein